jgi:hypothetical protein
MIYFVSFWNYKIGCLHALRFRLLNVVERVKDGERPYASRFLYHNQSGDSAFHICAEIKLAETAFVLCVYANHSR